MFWIYTVCLDLLSGDKCFIKNENFVCSCPLYIFRSYLSFFVFTGLTLLTVFLPILVSFLLDEKSLPVASRYARQIHEDSLSRLMKIGPLYPAQFRTIMSSQGQLKTRLEAAVKCSQAAKAAAVKAQEAAKVTATPPKPTITLKTSFGNFS